MLEQQRSPSEALTVSVLNSQSQVTNKPLRDSVKQALRNYLSQLDGQDVNDRSSSRTRGVDYQQTRS